MKRLALLLILALIFCGCKKQETPVYRVVTGVQVEYSDGTDIISRNYTRSASIQSVLTYLRILRPYGPAVPKEETGKTCRITLRYSHGPDSVYMQQGNQYLRKNEGPWQSIDNARANLLYPLLLLLPSDV